jgi:hypothetical protein
VVEKSIVLREASIGAPIAVSIPAAATMVGVSRAKFYTQWINGGLIRPVDLGIEASVVPSKASRWTRP